MQAATRLLEQQQEQQPALLAALPPASAAHLQAVAAAAPGLHPRWQVSKPVSQGHVVHVQSTGPVWGGLVCRLMLHTSPAGTQLPWLLVGA